MDQYILGFLSAFVILLLIVSVVGAFIAFRQKSKFNNFLENDLNIYINDIYRAIDETTKGLKDEMEKHVDSRIDKTLNTTKSMINDRLNQLEK